MAGYVYYPPAKTGFDLEATLPAIHAWRRRLAGLPAWKPVRANAGGRFDACTCGLKLPELACRLFRRLRTLVSECWAPRFMSTPQLVPFTYRSPPPSPAALLRAPDLPTPEPF
jgi:hypothetical protein